MSALSPLGAAVSRRLHSLAVLFIVYSSFGSALADYECRELLQVLLGIPRINCEMNRLGPIEKFFLRYIEPAESVAIFYNLKGANKRGFEVKSLLLKDLNSNLLDAKFDSDIFPDGFDYNTLTKEVVTYLKRNKIGYRQIDYHSFNGDLRTALIISPGDQHPIAVLARKLKAEGQSLALESHLDGGGYSDTETFGTETFNNLISIGMQSFATHVSSGLVTSPISFVIRHEIMHAQADWRMFKNIVFADRGYILNHSSAVKSQIYGSFMHFQEITNAFLDLKTLTDLTEKILRSCSCDKLGFTLNDENFLKFLARWIFDRIQQVSADNGFGRDTDFILKEILAKARSKAIKPEIRIGRSAPHVFWSYVPKGTSEGIEVATDIPENVKTALKLKIPMLSQIYNLNLLSETSKVLYQELDRRYEEIVDLTKQESLDKLKTMSQLLDDFYRGARSGYVGFYELAIELAMEISSLADVLSPKERAKTIERIRELIDGSESVVGVKERIRDPLKAIQEKVRVRTKTLQELNNLAEQFLKFIQANDKKIAELDSEVSRTARVLDFLSHYDEGFKLFDKTKVKELVQALSPFADTDERLAEGMAKAYLSNPKYINSDAFNLSDPKSARTAINALLGDRMQLKPVKDLDLTHLPSENFLQMFLYQFFSLKMKPETSADTRKKIDEVLGGLLKTIK